jgi:hypothetical protein
VDKKQHSGNMKSVKQSVLDGTSKWSAKLAITGEIAAIVCFECHDIHGQWLSMSWLWDMRMCLSMMHVMQTCHLLVVVSLTLSLPKPDPHCQILMRKTHISWLGWSNSPMAGWLLPPTAVKRYRDLSSSAGLFKTALALSWR